MENEYCGDYLETKLKILTDISEEIASGHEIERTGDNLTMIYSTDHPTLKDTPSLLGLLISTEENNIYTIDHMPEDHEHREYISEQLMGYAARLLVAYEEETLEEWFINDINPDD